MSGDSPSKVFSINISSWRFWAWFAARTVFFATVLYAAINYIAVDVFDTQLRVFHREVKPEIYSHVNDQIQLKILATQQVFLEEVAKLESHNAASDEKLKALKETQAVIQSSVKEVNNKLDVIIQQNGRH